MARLPRSPQRTSAPSAGPSRPSGQGPAPSAQRTFDDLGIPLHDVTFVVIDLETTGASPAECEITEVGAVKYRGGECLGTFQTLVNPGVPIPPFVTVLTGLTDALVTPAPLIDAVLPALVEFVGPNERSTVIVGHNVRFDLSFLDAACTRLGYPRFTHTRVDTVALARRLVRDEVPNLRLATLARRFRTAVEPIHRALDDARATAEVLHGLLERAGSLGVLGLDDLVDLPRLRAHPSSAKLRMTTGLPRTPGVYLFRDRGGRVLYVGKATNLRARVRSYFGSDDRRKVPQLLRELASIDHVECADPFEAAVRELRLIQRYEPRFNRQAKAWRSYAYLKLTLDERFPRLAVTREPRAGAAHLGPFRSAAAAHAVRDAIETAAPLRRCTRRVGRNAALACEPCVPAQLGVASCPCSGQTPAAEYADVVDVVRRAFAGDARGLLAPLEERMRRLADGERFEEAALARDRLRALSSAIARQRLADATRAVRRLVVTTPATTVVLVHGRAQLGDHSTHEARDTRDERDALFPDLSLPPRREEIDELLLTARWLTRAGGQRRASLVETAGTWASPLPPLPVYEVRRPDVRSTR